VSAQFGHFCVQPYFGKQARDFRSKAQGGVLLFVGNIAQDVAHFFLHAAAMGLGAAL